MSDLSIHSDHRAAERAILAAGSPWPLPTLLVALTRAAGGVARVLSRKTGVPIETLRAHAVAMFDEVARSGEEGRE